MDESERQISDVYAGFLDEFFGTLLDSPDGRDRVRHGVPYQKLILSADPWRIERKPCFFAFRRFPIGIFRFTFFVVFF